MIFDNRKIVARLTVRRYLSLFVFLIIMALLLLLNVVKRDLWGMDRSFYVFITCTVYVFYVVYAYFRSYNFFSFNDEEEKLVFRFISLRPFDNEKKAIEIAKKDFGGYEFRKTFLGFKQELILKVKTKKGVANYPPISITAISKKHKIMLENAFDILIKSI
jgi:Ca2+/Na+ antiporter